jgi:hypothetical protein
MVLPCAAIGADPNDVPTATKTGDSITNLTIGKLPKSGRFVVIVATYANGAKWASQQTYKRCKKKKRRR